MIAIIGMSVGGSNPREVNIISRVANVEVEQAKAVTIRLNELVTEYDIDFTLVLFNEEIKGIYINLL